MPSFCPHCGAEAPEEARFCMRCGKERVPPTPAAPPTPPTVPDRAVPPAPVTPPPPTYQPPPAHPAPAGPSPVGAFFGRAFRGDWAGAAQAALWPVGLLLVGAVALAIPGYGQDSGGDDFVGFGDRLRIALTVLMHGLGGSFRVTASTGGGSSLFDSASDTSAGGSFDLFMPPLLVPVLWCVALLIGVRMLRTRMVLARQPGTSWGPPPARTLGLETAVRVGLLAMAGTVVLALFGQPTVQQVEFHSAPFLVALCTLALGIVVTVAVFQRADIAQWLAVRPGVAVASRAFGSAVRAMAWVLPLVLVAGFVVGIIANESGDGRDGGDVDDATGGSVVAGIVLLALYLPNLALTGLGFVWGAPVEADLRGSGLGGSQYEHDSYGLGRLGDDVNSGAVIGVLVFGLVLALLVGVLVARRSRDRRELYLGGGFFSALLLVLCAVSGFSVETSGGLTGELSFAGTGEGGLNMPELLLFGLLWVGGGVFLAPYLLRLGGSGTGFGTGFAGAAAGPALPAFPPTAPPSVPPTAPGAAPFGTGTYELPPVGDLAAAPTQTASVLPPPMGPPAPPTVPPSSEAYDPYTVHLAPKPGAAPAGPKRHTGVWVGTLLGAFVIGGGAAAGVLLLQDDGDGGKDDAKDNKPVAAQTEQTGGTDASPEPPASPTPTEPPVSADTAVPSATPEIPAGYHQVFDPKGFSFAVPGVWDRIGIRNDSQITYAGSTGMEKYIVGVIPHADYTSYENLQNLETHLKGDTKKTHYQRVRLEKNTFQGEPGALWEYTYEDEAGRTIHGIDQSYIAADGTEYAIFLTGKDDVWSEMRETYRIGLDSWRLTDTE
ncbi:zinc ribbon domain-containing protein [Streptomyces sp. NPDC059639]|uniref:zinc ribbon domain-containing protein n=1 Tax=Streptomyces sp. NPDC059639 TaxID=3346891 RepID=UPI0036CA8BF3